MSQTNIPTLEPLLTPEEVAKLLKLPKTTIYEHARTGALTCVRIGRRVRFRRREIEALLNGETAASQ